VSGPPKGLNEGSMCLKNGGFFQTSLLSNGGFGYIGYPLLSKSLVFHKKLQQSLQKKSFLLSLVLSMVFWCEFSQ
jgi:hypothetical protein